MVQKCPSRGQVHQQKDSFSLSPKQNVGPFQNGPIRINDLGLPLKRTLQTNPNVASKPLDSAHNTTQAAIVEVRAPPQHVEPPTPATSEACTPHSSQPGSAWVALSCVHVVAHNTSFPPGNNKGASPAYDQPNTALAINVENLAIKLREYPLREQAQELENGFRFGFRLGFIGEKIGQKSKNLTSALELKTKTLEKINKEIEKGRVAGPFETVPLCNFRSSPIGLVPKQNCREITDSYTICHGPREHQSMIK